MIEAMNSLDVTKFLKESGIHSNGRTQRRHHQQFFKGLTSQIQDSPCLKNFIPVADTDNYINQNLKIPLYHNSKTSLLSSLCRHFFNFTSNNGMSKTALTMCLTNEKKALPEPNCLPNSYEDAHRLIKPLLIPSSRFDACVNDCLLYRKTEVFDYSMDKQCRICGEERYKTTGAPKKTYTYMPVGPRLARIFGTESLSKIMYGRPDLRNTGEISDISGGNIYKSWFRSGGVFHDSTDGCSVPLALFCDGLNPNKSMATQKSMWPIILTCLNLPVNIRHVLGPMMLVGIVPGTKTEEPKNLDPYLDILVDELLSLCNMTVFSDYKGAPTPVKVALLHFMCDIPAFSKILHVSNQAALRGCPYCKEEGQYCKSLHKVIHLHNRSFLPNEHPLRTNRTDFAIKGVDNSTKPKPFSYHEEQVIRETYDNLPNNHRKNILQKQTGLKGTYSFMRLPYHNRLEQMQPDGMHTIADVISNVLGMVTGKDDTKKVRQGEEEYGRFQDTWFPVKDNLPDNRKRAGNTADCPSKAKKSKSTNSPDTETLPQAPWRLDKKNLKLADERAQAIQYPSWIDYQPDQHFSKPWTLRTMHGKHQFVKSGAALWCLRGLLPIEQETTLSKFFSSVAMLTKESFSSKEIQEVTVATSEAISLLERDFPVALQTITTHLMHHIPEGFADFGPLYGRWLFPYERVNCWITRQALNRNKVEATIMETYAIYDWCAYMVMSGKVDNDDVDLGKLKRLVIDKEQPKENQKKTGKKVVLSDKILQEMSNIYDFCLFSRMKKEGEEIDNVTRSYGHTNRLIRFSDSSSGKTVNCYVYTIKVNETCQYTASALSVNSSESVVFGKISKIFKHEWREQVITWVLLDVFESVLNENGFWSVKERVSSQKVVMLKDISEPQVVGRENGRLYYVSTNIVCKTD